MPPRQAGGQPLHPIYPLAGNSLPVATRPHGSQRAKTDRARRGGLYRETESSRMLRSWTQLTPHLAIRVAGTVHVDVELIVVIRTVVRVADVHGLRHREAILAGLGQGHYHGAVCPGLPAMNMGRGGGEPGDRDGAEGLRAVGPADRGPSTPRQRDDDVSRTGVVAAHGRNLLTSGEPGNGHPMRS